MFVAHLGAGLALRGFEPRLNAGLLVFAALFSDVLLWILVLVGVEQVHVPAHFTSLRYLTFTFPWSHGLVASVVWSALAAGLVGWRLRSARCAAFVGGAVLSHFVLDAVSHPAVIPLLGKSSPKVGLGLWDNMVGALFVEFLLSMAGLSLYLVGSQDRSQGRRVGMAVLVVSMTGMALAGQGSAIEAPSPGFAAASSLITIGILCTIAVVLDRGVTPSASSSP